MWVIEKTEGGPLFSGREILDIAIRIEKNGEAVYRRAMEKVSNPVLVALLEWIADEEVRHAQWFADRKQNAEGVSDSPIVEEMNRELLNDLLEGQSFSLEGRDFSAVETVHEMITIFIEFEQDTVLFYEMIAPFVEGEETLVELQKIIVEENRHIAHLKEFLLSEAAVEKDED